MTLPYQARPHGACGNSSCVISRPKEVSPMTLRHPGGRRCLACGTLALSLVATGCQRATPVQFRITVPKARRTTPVDGRLLVILSKDPTKEPRMQISGNMSTQQFFGVNVDGL